MTRSTDEWIGKTDDSKIPPRVIERVARRADGRCCKCTRETGPALPGECDHVIPLILGGQHRESNFQWLCKPCHGAKTKLDVKLKAKVSRVHRQHRGIRKPRTITRWRRFDGSIVEAGRER